MAEVKGYPAGITHFRGSPTAHVVRYQKGKKVASGKGLSFWFRPLSTSIAEIPVADMELPFLFHARSSDFQDVATQGTVSFRVADPEALADRVDFTVDLRTGAYRKAPLEQVAGSMTNLAQRLAWDYLSTTPLERILTDGVDEVRQRISQGMRDEPRLAEMGLEVVVVNVTRIAPTADVEKALMTPTFEAMQQSADQAMFERRALAVEKERAIRENELQSEIELSKREEQLVAQRGQNERRRAEEEAKAGRISAEAAAAAKRIEAAASAESIEQVGRVRTQLEEESMRIYSGMPPQVLVAMAAREIAGKLKSIDHLSITPDMFTPVLTDLLQAGTRALEGKAK